MLAGAFSFWLHFNFCSLQNIFDVLKDSLHIAFRLAPPSDFLLILPGHSASFLFFRPVSAVCVEQGVIRIDSVPCVCLVVPVALDRFVTKRAVFQDDAAADLGSVQLAADCCC